MCNECKEKDTCPFYEKDAEECVYEALASLAKISSKKEN